LRDNLLGQWIVNIYSKEKQMQNKKNYIIHMIGNAHIDPVWLWCWSEGAETIRATFQSAIERIEEHPQQ